MEAFEYVGEWWLPENPDNKFVGKLSFTPEKGAYLKTIEGVFAESYEGMPVALDPYDDVSIILGKLHEGKLVTLWQCLLVQAPENINQSGWFKSGNYFVTIVFIGCHFETEADIKFNSMSIQYTHLAEWLNQNGFSRDYNDKKNNPVKLKLIYTQPKPIQLRVDDFNIRIGHILNTKGSFEFTAKQTTFIEITPDDLYGYDKYENFFYHIRNFISLGVGKPIFPIQILGVNKDEKIKKSGGIVAYHHLSFIDIFYSPNGKKFAPDEEPVISRQMFFGYENVADNFETYLKTWFEKAEKLEVVFNLFFSLLYLPRIYAPYVFLNLAQALETYHRQMYKGEFLSKEEYEPIKKKLKASIKNLSEIDSKFQERIGQSIDYSYEYTLKNRLELILNEILAPYQKVIYPLIGDYGIFAKTFKDMRNHFTHYGEPVNEQFLDGHNLYVIIEVTKFLLRFCFFVELGIPQKTVIDLMKRNSAYSQFVQMKKWWIKPKKK